MKNVHYNKIFDTADVQGSTDSTHGSIASLPTNNTHVSITSLQGIWAENEKDNAIFFIKGDSLYYVEDQNKGIEIKINSDTLVIMGDVPVRCKILMLTKDSLWYIDEFSDMPTKLYKRKTKNQ